MPRYRPKAPEFIAMEIDGDWHIELPDGTVIIEYSTPESPQIFPKLFEVVPAVPPAKDLEESK